MMEEIIQMEKISDLLERSDDLETFYDCLYEIYVLIGVAKGIDDVNNDRGMSIEESKERMMQKIENYSTRYGS